MVDAWIVAGVLLILDFLGHVGKANLDWDALAPKIISLFMFFVKYLLIFVIVFRFCQLLVIGLA